MGALVWLVGVGASPELVIGIVFVTYLLATPYRPAFTAGVPFVVGERAAAPERALAIGASDRHVSGALARLRGRVALHARWAFAVNASTFALSALLLFRVPRLSGGSRVLHECAGLGASSRRDLHEGVDAVLHQTGLAVMMWLIFVFSVARGFELVLLVLVARDHLGMGAEGVGVLNAAIGVGAIAAIPLIGRTIVAERPVWGSLSRSC